VRIGFVPGVMPDRWARTWRERHPGDVLDLVPVEEADGEPALRAGDLDMALLRLPVDRTGLHVVALYREVPVAVVSREHVASVYDEVSAADLADEQFVLGPPDGVTPATPQAPWPPMTVREAVEVAASGSGIVVLPLSLARLHHRKDVRHVRVSDLPETEVALVWPVTRDAADTQDFVGVVRGRTSRSSR
jgi:DNA-binding transcriptional LysR family regulator